MIISNQQVQNLLRIYNTEFAPGKSNRAKELTAKQLGRDELALSGEGKIKQRAFQAIKKSPDMREEKVEELKEKISTGNYTLSEKEVAEKMIARAIVDELV